MATDLPDWTTASSTTITGPVTVEGTLSVSHVTRVTETVTIQSPPKTSILTGTNKLVATERLTGTGAPKQISGSGGTVLYGVILKARKANKTPIYIGGSNVSIDSWPLDPGETTSLPPVDPLTTLWFLGAATDELDVFAL